MNPIPLLGIVFLVIGAFAVLAGTSYALGALLTFRLGYASRLQEWAVATSLGMGILGSMMLALGTVGLLARPVVVGSLLLVHLAAVGVWRRDLRRARLALGRLRLGRREVSGVLLVALLLAPLAVLQLYPPTAFDATLYHLPYADAFIAAERVTVVPDLRYPVFPQLHDLLFTLMLLLAGDLTASGVELLSVLLVAAAVYDRAVRWRARGAGLWAAGLWLGSPAVVFVGSGAYVDAGLAAFTTLAVLAWIEWWSCRRIGWLVLAGTFGGFAAATKYHGLAFLAVLALASAWASLRDWSPRPVVVFALVGGLVALPWYARIYAATGNPFFPVLSGIFGQTEWTLDLADHDVETLPETPDTPLWKALPRVPAVLGELVVRRFREESRALLMLPWDLTLGWRRSGYAVPLSPFFLITLPAILWLGWRSAAGRGLGALIVLYGVLWFSTARDVRYLVPATALLALLAAVAVDRWWEAAVLRWSWLGARGPSLLLTCALLLPSSAFALWELQRNGPPPASRAEREAYLTRRFPLYAPIRFLDQTRGGDYSLYALHAENLRYYAAGSFLGDWYGPARYSRIWRHYGDARALRRQLEELGAGLFLVPGCETTLRLTAEAVAEEFTTIYRDRSACVYELKAQARAPRSPAPQDDSAGAARTPRSTGSNAPFVPEGHPVVDPRHHAPHGGAH